MKISKAEFHIEDKEEYEEMLNNLFIGLEQFKKTHLDFNFKIFQYEDIIEVKTFKLNESVN